jgi:glycosyltransferase involved in cell wall biosynthesis
MLLLIKFFFIRIKDIFRLHNFDIIFIQREAFFIGPAFFEWIFSKLHKKIIYDFDDSIWLPNVSDANSKFDFLKCYFKIKNIIRYSNVVFAGNNYLLNFAIKYNNNVKLIPTTIDTDKFCPSVFPNKTKGICIGWSGSITTVKYFDFATIFLSKIKEKYKDNVYFKVIGDATYQNETLGIKGIAWSPEDEIEQLSEIDIGIMPLPNDEWTKGKCALKALFFMSMQIPVVLSPIGVNSEIIIDGENGFLADNNEQWIEKLSLLIESQSLRQKLGIEGRNTVLKNFSVETFKKKYLHEFNSLF